MTFLVAQSAGVSLSDVIQLGGLAAVILIPILKALGELRKEFMSFKIEQAKLEGAMTGQIAAVRSEQQTMRERVSRLEKTTFSSK